MSEKKASKFPWFEEKFGFKTNVKFTDKKGVVHYGEVQNPDITMGSYGKEAAAAYKKGNVFIKDAVTPKTCEVPHETVTIIEYGNYLKCTDRNGFSPLMDNDLERYQADEGNKALAASEKAAGRVVPGAMFRLPQGDGYAFYVVTKVEGTQCLVEHRHFGGDDWYDHHFGLGGWFSKRSILPYVKREYGLNQIFKAK